ncbi:MAG: leucine-rich repeat domain-containing protein [Planctomycetes bacterium]|nr:leucine-rich repeat domain-containing protein [Planctomycetota bacterium]
MAKKSDKSPEQIARERIAVARRYQHTGLDLSNLGLTAFPTEIGKLTSLIELNLNDNQLTTLPAELGKLTRLKALELDNNPLTDPPPEVVAQGTQAVLSYLRERMEGSRRQWTAKLLVVGEGSNEIQRLIIAKRLLQLYPA